MKEKKFTDEEIVQALEDMASECETNFSASVVDLIHRQKEEIERLKDENIEQRDIHFKNLCGYKDEIARLNAKYRNLEINYNAVWEDFRKYEVENAEQKAEIERLTEENSKLRIEIVSTLNEKAELQKQVDELTSSREIAINELHEQHAIVAEEIRRQTAKEILQEYGYLLSQRAKDEIKQRYGVEVE